MCFFSVQFFERQKMIFFSLCYLRSYGLDLFSHLSPICHGDKKALLMFHDLYA